MKKSILTLALAFVAVFGFNAAAQTTANQKADKAKTEKAEMKNKKADKMDRAFEGINLTEDQKAKILALKPKKADNDKAKADKAKAKENRDKAKAQMKERKEKAKEAKAQAQANRLKSRQDYLASIKSILTPEQYTKFLENNFVQKGSFEKGRRPAAQKHGKKHSARPQRKA